MTAANDTVAEALPTPEPVTATNAASSAADATARCEQSDPPALTPEQPNEVLAAPELSSGQPARPQTPVQAAQDSVEGTAQAQAENAASASAGKAAASSAAGVVPAANDDDVVQRSSPEDVDSIPASPDAHQTAACSTDGTQAADQEKAAALHNHLSDAQEERANALPQGGSMSDWENSMCKAVTDQGPAASDQPPASEWWLEMDEPSPWERMRLIENEVDLAVSKVRSQAHP